MPSWKSTAWGVLFIILIASVPTSHVFRLIDWFSRLLSSLSSPSSIMNINHLLMSYLHLFDKNWPTCIWRWVLQDLQRALQHDGAFPQRAHKEQYHLPWVSLDKALTIKYDPLTRPWQSLDKIWSHFSNRSDLSDLHKEVAPEILPSDLGWGCPKSKWRSLYLTSETVDCLM